MQNNEEIKKIVKEKYGKIAKQSASYCVPTSCCGTENKKENYSIMKNEYNNLTGYVEEANLGLGCGLPTEYAGIKRGDIVVDLGCGAGIDVFVARSIVGENGKVIGIDIAEEMINKAKQNNFKLGYNNVEFRLGDIEYIPIEDNSIDVVLSNCVLNLVPDKEKAFAEIHRILKKGGHFCISDIITKGNLPEKLKKSAELYTGCIAGAINKDDYLRIISDAGFSNVEVKTSKKIQISDSMLFRILDKNELLSFKNNEFGIYSITVVGFKI